jgi:AcrR family transcriptional regulator
MFGDRWPSVVVPSSHHLLGPFDKSRRGRQKQSWDRTLKKTNASNVEPKADLLESGPRLGRPRDMGVHRRILRTTLSLLEAQSVKDITIEAIAREAGVSKVTIYRWWSSKALLIIEAFMEGHLVRTPMQRDLPPGERIARHLAMLTEQYAGLPGRIVGQIIAEGQFDPDTLREFRERFHYGRRAVVREVMEEWRLSGDIAPDTNVEALMDLLYAPIYMRLLLGHAPLDRSFVVQHVTYAYSLLGARIPELG